MCKEQTFRSEVYAKDSGFVVERYHPNGKLVDRYFTTDLTQPRKSKDWSAGVAAIASQPSACLPVEQTLSAKLAKLDAYLEKELQQAMQEAHDAEFKILPFATPVIVQAELISLSHPDLTGVPEWDADILIQGLENAETLQA